MALRPESHHHMILSQDLTNMKSCYQSTNLNLVMIWVLNLATASASRTMDWSCHWSSVQWHIWVGALPFFLIESLHIPVTLEPVVEACSSYYPLSHYQYEITVTTVPHQTCFEFFCVMHWNSVIVSFSPLISSCWNKCIYVSNCLEQDKSYSTLLGAWEPKSDRGTTFVQEIGGWTENSSTPYWYFCFEK